jgi:hypothetical protein
MSDNEIWRHYRMSGVCRRAEVRTIDGVDFDLRHDELDRSEWEPINSLDWPVHAAPYAPRLLFPWADPQERFNFENRGEGVEVMVGDKLVIAEVTRMPVQAERGDLDHPHHRERRWARLAVLRRAGERVLVQHSWEFRGVSDVMTPIRQSDWGQAKQALTRRLAGALGIDDVDDIVLADSRELWAHLIEGADPGYVAAAEALWASEGNSFIEDAGVAFGYLMGRAEAKDLILPGAERRQEIATRNRATAQRPRQSGNLTRAAAAELLLRNPDMSRKRCAEVVAGQRSLSDAKSVQRTIGSLFRKDGDGKWRADLVAARAIVAERGQ